MFQNLASLTVLLIPDLTGVTNSVALPITPPAVATPPFCGIAGVDHPSLVKVHNLVQPDLCRVISPTLSHLYTARPSWWFAQEPRFKKLAYLPWCVLMGTQDTTLLSQLNEMQNHKQHLSLLLPRSQAFSDTKNKHRR